MVSISGEEALLPATMAGSYPRTRARSGAEFRQRSVDWRDPDMCGQDAQRRIVRELLRRAQRGIGGVLLVEGAWGMGKSALLHEAGRLAAGQGFSLASGRADPLGQMVPFFSLLSALNELIWHAIAEMIPRPARKALHRQFGEFLLNRGGSAASAAAHLLQAADQGDPREQSGQSDRRPASPRAPARPRPAGARSRCAAAQR